MEEQKNIESAEKKESPAAEAAAEKQPAPHGKISKQTKTYLILAGCFVALFVGMFIWKALAVRSAENRFRLALEQKTQELLRLSGIPFSWAVRREMIAGNFDQINEYLTHLVKEPHIKLVVVAKDDGVIAAATDKKLEGTKLSDHFPEELLRLDALSIVSGENGEIRVASPIMGFNTRLGLMILIYAPE
ncbi:MAG: hypothetical protein JW747_03920 [Candidatus Aminicenantes bacterium]|nr:hypothetical protein [Candidatus Aminicenantes bacterium]